MLVVAVVVVVVAAAAVVGVDSSIPVSGCTFQSHSKNGGAHQAPLNSWRQYDMFTIVCVPASRLQGIL